MLGKSEVWKREEVDDINEGASDTRMAFKPRGLDGLGSECPQRSSDNVTMNGMHFNKGRGYFALHIKNHTVFYLQCVPCFQ